MDERPGWKWGFNWRTGITWGPIPVGLIAVGALAAAVLLWLPSRLG